MLTRRADNSAACVLRTDLHHFSAATSKRDASGHSGFGLSNSLTDSLGRGHDLLLEKGRIRGLRNIGVSASPHRKISGFVQPYLGENDDCDSAFCLFQERTEFKSRLQRKEQFHDHAVRLVTADQPSRLTAVGSFEDGPVEASQEFADRGGDPRRIDQYDCLDQALPVVGRMDA